jgi:hypothetical protein
MAQAAQGGDKNTFVGTVKLGDQTVDPNDVIDISIESELDSPDHVTLHLGKTQNTLDLVSKLKLTNPISVTTLHGGDPTPDVAFIGEITGIEPMFAATGETRGHTLIHGYNGLHSLSRGKRSIAYSRLPDKITDQQILDDIKKRYSGIITSVDYGDGKKPPSIEYKHVYQHNQTDLEFIRHRASRIGYYVLVQDKTLLFQERTATVSSINLVLNQKRTVDGASSGGQTVIAMNSFVPQLSTANQFSLVRVRSFKPAERVEIVRTYPKGSDQALYGSGDTGPTSSKEKHPDAPFVRVDIPFDTEEEGDALAKSIAMERMLNYITAEGSTPGDPRLKAGMVVTVATGQKYYDGKYLITRVRHWFRRKSKHPYTTDFHAQRDATDQAAGGSSQSANAPSPSK